MKCLFLPNFPVRTISADNPEVPAPNKLVKGKPYWFFRHVQDCSVDVIDNSGILPSSVNPWRGNIEVLQSVRALLSNNDYDFMLSHSYNSVFFASYIRSLTGIRTPPLFVIDIGCLNGHRDHPLEIKVLKRALKSVNGVIYHSRVNEEFYSRHFPSLRTRFLHFGTDLEFFRPLARQQSLDFALSIGRVHRDYGTLLSSWKTVDFPLRVVGPGLTIEPGSNHISIMREISILRLRELIHDARLVVLPITGKRYSVGQMTLTQCMAMGKAIVVTKVPGIADYVQPEQNCICVAPGDKQGLADSANRIINDDRLRDHLSRNALRTAREMFDEELMARGIIDFVRTDSATDH